MKRLRNAVIYFAVFLALSIGGYWLLGVSQQTVSFGETKVQVDIADDGQERLLGLGDYDGLNANQGLLFVFEQPDKHGIWMKDVEFPIDVVWLDESRNIIHIVKEMQPSSYPEVSKPDQNAKYVIELPAGFVENNNVNEGDNVEFSF